MNKIKVERNTEPKKQFIIYCSYPYSDNPKGRTGQINQICKRIYERCIPDVDLVLLIPHNIFDAVFDYPIGDSNEWMLGAELYLIERCDAFAYSPGNQSSGTKWERAYAEKLGLPVLTYDQLLQGVRPFKRGRRIINMRKMREFETGATRDADEDKLDYEGFLSPIVLKAYAEYMHVNRRQVDGKLRPSDNWQKGMPLDVYMKSMFRHFMDVWFCHRGLTHLSREGLQVGLGGLLFNTMGYWFEVLKAESLKLRDEVKGEST